MNEDKLLEEELRREVEHGPEVPSAEALEPEAPVGTPAWLKIGAILTTLVGVVVYLLLNTDAGDAMAYSTAVAQVVSEPGSFQDRELRVEGTLRQGSIQFREDPCEWRFVLEEENQSLPVRFPQCVVPDTFRDGFGISVTVQGRLEDEGFLANEVIPRCPSKYEMEERLNNGEEMPHGPNGPPAATAG